MTSEEAAKVARQITDAALSMASAGTPACDRHFLEVLEAKIVAALAPDGEWTQEVAERVAKAAVERRVRADAYVRAIRA